MIYFPFSAIIGQEDVKKALILAAIQPSIQGVLIVGEKGTAKSTLVRSFARLMAPDFLVECPISITEDRLVGSIDFEKAIQQGMKKLEPGLLQEADGRWLYIDEVNLLGEQHMQVIAETLTSRILKMEREGLSYQTPTHFTLIGTMNPEEGKLPPQFLDRFGFYVEVKGSAEIENRVQIIKQRLMFEKDPEAFYQMYAQEEERLRQEILSARKRLPDVQVDESIVQLAVAISLEGNCAGHRAELLLIEAGKAIAAWNSRSSVTEEDIKMASFYVLPHRLRDIHEQHSQENLSSPPSPEVEEPEQEEQEADDRQHSQPDLRDSAVEQKKQECEQKGPPPPSVGEEQKFGIDERVQMVALRLQRQDRKKREGVGKRSISRTRLKRGRFVRAIFPRGKVTDLSFMDTLRAAAPYQKTRKKENTAISIHKNDFREKEREKRMGTSILFAVDASGSMTANKRMSAVKGAIYSLLESAYVERDHVSMIVFRKQDAELVLPMTRSLVLARKKLAEIPSGGKTPLALGLVKSVQYLTTLKRKQKEILPFLVIVTDGRANVPYLGENALEDAFSVARQIGAMGIKTLIIDTEEKNKFVNFGLAKRLAEEMNATYWKLSDLTSTEITQAVRISI